MSHDSPVTLTLDRGLQVLRAFRADRAPLTDAELAQRTGLSRSAVLRLTSTLLHLGYLRHAAGGARFELASGVLGIGQAWLDADPISRAAMPVIQALADKLGMAVALAVPDQLDMLTIAYGAGGSAACVESPRLGVGALAPMACTAIGRAWLWGLPEYERRRYLLRLLEAADSQTEMLRKAIESAFEELRTWGACAAQEMFEHDVYGSIALPLRAGQWRMPMALAVTTLDSQLDIESMHARIKPELSQTARELTVLLADIRVGPPGH